MSYERFLQPRDRRVDSAGSMQRHSVDVGIPRVARIKSGGKLDFTERGVVPFQAHQGESERVMQDCALGRDFESVAQNTLTVAIVVLRAVKVGEIDVSGN